MTQKNSANVNLKAREGQTLDAARAELALTGIVRHAHVASTYASCAMGEVPLSESIDILIEKASRIHNGNLQEAESMLITQAITLDTIFTEMSRRAALNMGQHLSAMETYMRLALKAQSQCRATLETLAEMKNPRPVAFVKQANIATNQQVNNGTPSPSRTEKNKNQPNELLLEQQHHETVDTGGTPAASGTDTQLEAVGAQHGSKNAGRKKAIQP